MFYSLKRLLNVIGFLFLIIWHFGEITQPAEASDQSKVFFDYPLQSDALKKFFGSLSGSYIIENSSLVDQFEAGLAIDLSSMGIPINKMANLGNGEHLDAGEVYHVGFSGDGGAVILMPDGEITAAALYVKDIVFSPTQLSSSCGDGQATLVIFLKGRKQDSRYIRIFKSWAKQFCNAQTTHDDWVTNSVLGSNAWANSSDSFLIPSKIIFVKNF